MMPHRIINQLRTHYEESGAGDAILFLHGLGSCAQDWLLQMPVFAERFRVVAPDLAGHGESDKPQGHVRVADLASDVIGLLDALEVSCAHVVGLSLGGCVAQQLALDFPSRVRSLTLVNTFARFDLGGPGNALPLARLGWKMVGTDLSWPMLSAAANRTREENLDDRFRGLLAPMESIPVRDRSVDLVIAHGIWNLARSAAQFRKAVDEAVTRHLEKNEPYRIELRMRHKDGSYRWILTRGEALRDAAGRAVRMTGSISDATRGSPSQPRARFVTVMPSCVVEMY